MEKAPGAAPEAPEEKPKTPEPPKLTTEDKNAEEFRDELESFLRRTGDTQSADAVAAESKDQEGPARRRGAVAEIEEHKRAIEDINKAVQENRTTEYYKEAGYNRARAQELAEEDVARREGRVRELEEMKAAREAKPDVIELTEDMVVKETDPRRTKTLEDDPTVDADALNKRYEKTLDSDPNATAEKKEAKKAPPFEEALKKARPRVREVLTKMAQEKAATLVERSALMVGGKVIELGERLFGYPGRRRQEAQQKVLEYEKHLQEIRAKQAEYKNDPSMLKTLRAEEEKLEQGYIDARQDLGKAQNREAKFDSMRRITERSTRAIANEVLQKIDHRIKPYERHLDVVKDGLERADRAMKYTTKRLDAYREKIARLRGELRNAQDPIERGKLEAELKRIEDIEKSRLPLVKRLAQKREFARKELEKNEKEARPFRQQQRRFARAVGIELTGDLPYKGTPPEDLPIASKGQEKGDSKVVNLAQRRKEKGLLGRMFERKPEKVDQAGIDKFVRKWNGSLNPRFNMRIKDPEMFKSMFGEDQVISPPRMQHVLTKYFEAEAERRGKPLTGSERKQIKRGAGEALGKVFYMEGRTKKATKKVVGTAAKVAKKVIPNKKT